MKRTRLTNVLLPRGKSTGQRESTLNCAGKFVGAGPCESLLWDWVKIEDKDSVAATSTKFAPSQAQSTFHFLVFAPFHLTTSPYCLVSIILPEQILWDPLMHALLQHDTVCAAVCFV